MVRAFAHGAMDRRIDPSYGGPISRSGQCSTTGVTKAVVEGKGKGMFYLTTHSTHFIYGYMASDIWLRTVVCVILPV